MATRKSVKKVAPVPPQYGTATAALTVSPCKEAQKFYAKAFGAKLLGSMDGPGGLVMHAEMQIGDTIIMLNDEMPPMPGIPAHKTPKNAKGNTASMHLYVPNVDAAFKKAVAAGAKVLMPVSEQFWGDRYGQVEDPFGHLWGIASRKRNPTDKEIREAMAKMVPRK
jgi:uncharacterized glyoxalase superfamily protein PhnB